MNPVLQIKLGNDDRINFYWLIPQLPVQFTQQKTNKCIEPDVVKRTCCIIRQMKASQYAMYVDVVIIWTP